MKTRKKLSDFFINLKIPLHEKKRIPILVNGNNDITHWHIYAVDWTQDSMVFKIDGKVFYTVTRQMIAHYGPWAFSNNKFVILNMALGGDYPAKVNNTTQPYNGIPQSTVDQIKAGKAKMLVDWVLVTQAK